MRGSWHDTQIRRHLVDGTGMCIKEAFAGVDRIMSGVPTQSLLREKETLTQMFQAEDS
jgi:hypothetical protein